MTRTHHQGISLVFFSGFKVGNLDIMVSHLQYADATIFMGEVSVEIFWCMKSIHRWFQLVSSLKVNFSIEGGWDSIEKWEWEGSGKKIM